MSVRRRYFLVIVGVLVGVLLAEGLLRLYVAAVVNRHGSPAASENAIDAAVNDARLGYRGNPSYPGHDARGWRNTWALEQAEVVALGDSQTYGLNAAIGDAWPQRLSTMIRRSVYQMAVGGYGPVHYLLLFNEAAALKPKVLISTYYLGNDLFDSYWLAHRIRHFARTAADPLLDSLISTDRKTRDALSRAEAIDPNLLRIDYVDCQGVRSIPDPHLQLVHDILSVPPLARPVTAPSPPPSPRTRVETFLSRSFLLYRLGRTALRRLANRVVAPAEVKDYGPPLCVHYRDRQVTTIFNVGYRLIAVDRTDPRVVEGERISLQAFRLLAERARRAGIRFYVLLIPTKETAFRTHVEASLRTKPYLADLWRAEGAARSMAIDFFRRMGIGVIDALPALEAVIASGANPYLENADGHPVRAGYEAIARAVAERLNHDPIRDSR